MLCIICVASKFYKNRVIRQLTMTPSSSTEPSTKPETMNYNENLEGYPQETPENTLFDKWAQEITQFIEDSIQKRQSFYPKTASIQAKKETPRRKRSNKWYKFSTQKIRRDLARGLGKFYDKALANAQNPELTLAEQEKWGRLTAYTAQTINSITTTYDDVRIEETLDELKQFVKTQQKG